MLDQSRIVDCGERAIKTLSRCEEVWGVSENVARTGFQLASRSLSLRALSVEGGCGVG